MTFEGEHKIIPVKGIARAGADTLCEDGAMNEVIGLEYKDGSYVPYSGKITNSQLPSTLTNIYVHKTSFGNNVIILCSSTSGSKKLMWISEEEFNNGNGSTESDYTLICEDDVLDVEFMGNVMCVGAQSSYLIYLFADGAYSIYNDYSTNNEISIRAQEGIGGNSGHNVWFVDETDNEPSVSFEKAEYIAHEYGGLVGHVFVALACRLKTGEIVNMSNMKLFRSPRENAVAYTSGGAFELDNECMSPSGIIDVNTPLVADGVSNKEGYIVISSGQSLGATKGPQLYKFGYELNSVKRYGCVCSCYKLQLYVDASAFKNVDNVESICVLMSQDISRFGDFAESRKVSVSDYTTYYPVETLGALNDESLEDVRVMYVVGEYSLDEVERDSWFDIDLKGKLGDALASQPTFSMSNAITYKYENPDIHIYNHRVHLSGFAQNIYYPYSALTYDNHVGSSQTCIEIDVRLKTSTKEEYSIVIFRDNVSQSLNLGNFISFPSSDAYKIIVRKRIGTRNYIQEFILKKHPNMPISYSFISSDMTQEEDSYELPVGDALATSLQSTNKLVVSDTSTPDYFAKQNTYTIGNGTILGMASLSIALSQDTFGQYPLLVFCTDGIYSMGVDTTGAGVYSNISPFSREVCTNKNTICEIDGAVLFASSKGLMIASAQGVQEFLPALNGTPRHLPKDDKETNGLGLKLYRDAITNHKSTELLTCVSHDDFIQFLSDADTVVSYVSNKNKVIVYNKNHDYSYWIDIPTRVVTKLPIGISMDNNNYPTEQYLLNNGLVLEFGYLSQDEDVQCLLQSRPIKNSYGMKSTLRVIARGYFNSSYAGNYAVMLVLGSYDAINWQPIGICQRPFAGGFNDLGCVTDRVSHKYVMVIITGKMSPDSHIDGIEMTINSKYNNKLK